LKHYRKEFGLRIGIRERFISSISINLLRRESGKTLDLSGHQELDGLGLKLSGRQSREQYYIVSRLFPLPSILLYCNLSYNIKAYPRKEYKSHKPPASGRQQQIHLQQTHRRISRSQILQGVDGYNHYQVSFEGKVRPRHNPEKAIPLSILFGLLCYCPDENL
jgi:hypothetical protein